MWNEGFLQKRFTARNENSIIPCLMNRFKYTKKFKFDVKTLEFYQLTYNKLKIKSL